MKLITLSGGLGNQLFQYALFLRLKQNEKNIFVTLQKIKRHKEHNGYELERIFHISLSKRNQFIDYLICIPIIGKVFKHSLFPRKYRERILFSSATNRGIFLPSFVPIHYVGYWQSENYFLSVANEVRKCFKFDTCLMNNKTRDLSNIIVGQPNSVSIHIRRGDYRNHPELLNICTKKYYERAIAEIKERIANPIFYVFSDEPNVCSEILEDTFFTLVNWNKGKDSWQDMFLMSCCSSHITANSSFSWWGAWLCKSSVITIVPKKWHEKHESPEIGACGWLKVDSNGVCYK